MRTFGTMQRADAVKLYRREKARAERRHSRKDRAFVRATVNEFVDRVMAQVSPFPRTPAGKKPAAP